MCFPAVAASKIPPSTPRRQAIASRACSADALFFPYLLPRQARMQRKLHSSYLRLHVSNLHAAAFPALFFGQSALPLFESFSDAHNNLQALFKSDDGSFLPPFRPFLRKERGARAVPPSARTPRPPRAASAPKFLQKRAAVFPMNILRAYRLAKEFFAQPCAKRKVG